MKLKKTVTLMLVMLCVGTVALAEITVQTVADPTYVRSAPEIAENIMGELKANRVFEWAGHIAVDERGVAWLDLLYSDYKYGWVSSLHTNLLDGDTGEMIEMPISVSSETLVIATERVNVFSDPAYNSSVMGSMQTGDYAKFTGFKKKDTKDNLWYQINYNNISGWVPADSVSIF